MNCFVLLLRCFFCLLSGTNVGKIASIYSVPRYHTPISQVCFDAFERCNEFFNFELITSSHPCCASRSLLILGFLPKQNARLRWWFWQFIAWLTHTHLPSLVVHILNISINYIYYRLLKATFSSFAKHAHFPQTISRHAKILRIVEEICE